MQKCNSEEHNEGQCKAVKFICKTGRRRGKTSDLRMKFYTAEACGHLGTVTPNRLDQRCGYTKNTRFACTKFAHHAAREENLKLELLKVRV